MKQIEQLAAALPLLGQVNEGKDLEFLHHTEWIPADHRVIFKQLHEERFNPSNWRVKPDAPKVVPWVWLTAPETVRALRKSDCCVGWLNAWPDGASFSRNAREESTYTYAEAAEQFELLDGRPYGIEQKEESEWPKWAVDEVGDIWEAKNDRECRLYRKCFGYEVSGPHYIVGWSAFLRGNLKPQRVTKNQASRIMSEAKGGMEV